MTELNDCPYYRSGERNVRQWWSILWATSFLANLTGLILSQTMSSVVAIYITIPLLLIPQILLCGLVIKFDDLNTRASDENIVPLIGEVIPSRWAFEALMVEQFRDNAYNRPYFPIEKEKYLAQYYENVHSPEVRSLAEQIAVKDDPDKRKTVENELAVLSRAARIAPRTENESYLAHLDKVDAALHERAHNFTAYLDQIQQERGREEGAEQLTKMKKAHHNTAIEDLVMGTGGRHLYKEANHRIYPVIGQIYVEPDNRFGRAAFYSHEKNWAGYHISTYKFNLLVIGFFALLAIIAIFAEFPGRFLKRDEF